MPYVKQWYLRLDLKKQFDNPAMELIKQNVHGNIFNIQVFDEGTPSNLSEVNLVSVIVLKPDLTNVVGSAEIVDATQGKVKYNVDIQALSVLGICNVELQFFSEDVMVSSTEFKYTVKADLYQGTNQSVESTTEYPLLTQLLIDMTNHDTDYSGNEATRQSNEVTRIANEDSRILAETSRVDLFNTVSQSETTRGEQETTRQLNEAQRIINENSRGNAETTRESNEITRIQEETVRQGNEVNRSNDEITRGLAENTRETNEHSRANQEDIRQANEITRQSNETTRESNESDRGLNELQRLGNENARVNAENTRANAETNRVSQETTRQSNETSRGNAEGTRASAESTRVTAENTRNNSESTRVNSESTRVANESARVSAETIRNTNENARKASILDIENRFSLLQTSQQQASEVINARTSTTKAKTFANLSARIEEIEDDTVKAKFSAAIEATAAMYSIPSTGVVVGQLRDIAIKANTVNQVITNGNFANGATGWSATAGSGTTTNNTYSLTGTGVSTIVRVHAPISIPFNEGRKIFVRAKVKVTNSNCSAIRLGLTNTTTASQFVEQSSPLINQTYVLSGVITLTSGYDNNIKIVVQHHYVDNATANGKVMEVQEVMAIDLDAHGLSALTVAQCNERFPNWLRNGVVSTLPVRVKGINKNILTLNPDDWEQGSIGTIGVGAGTLLASTTRLRMKKSRRIVGGTNYAVSGASGYDIRAIRFEDSLGNVIGTTSDSPANPIAVPTNATHYRAVVRKTNDTTIVPSEITDAKPQLERGNTPTTFEAPVIGNEAYISSPDGQPYRSLPNGTYDEIYADASGQVRKAQRVSGEVILQSSDITTFSNSYTYIDEVRISYNNLIGILQASDSIGNKIVTNKTMPRNGATFDSVENQYKHSQSASYWIMTFPKGTYANLAAAQTALAGTSVNYQLATPITTQLQGIPQLTVGPGYTLIVENILKTTKTYGTGIVVAQPIKSIESVTKLDGDNRIPIALSSASFTGSTVTITGATANEVYEVITEYDSSLSTLPTLRYSYPINTAAIIDSNTKRIATMEREVMTLNDFTVAMLLNHEMRLIAGGH